jgi:hypothetical protein
LQPNYYVVRDANGRQIAYIFIIPMIQTDEHAFARSVIAAWIIAATELARIPLTSSNPET